MKIRTKCTEDAKICWGKFRSFMVAQTAASQETGRHWRETPQAKGLHVQGHGVLRRTVVTSFQSYH